MLYQLALRRPGKIIVLKIHLTLIEFVNNRNVKPIPHCCFTRITINNFKEEKEISSCKKHAYFEKAYLENSFISWL